MDKLKPLYGRQKDEDVVIVGLIGHMWTGIKPIKLCLPHQVYKHDVERIKKEYHAEKVVVIPAKSNDYFWLQDY
ncbi:hypothetical protein ABE073_04420 [Lederbergia citrisecunda]|uniref:hypothetical protein n=1 Tax=Lederbergia citrisecunda TaxID=2833583 RepID=UPI003D2AC040